MKKLQILGLSLAAAFAVAQAHGEELTGTLKSIKESGSITIAYREYSMPFSYLDDNQKPVGFAMDICYKIVDRVEVARLLGHEAACGQEMRVGEGDLLLPLGIVGGRAALDIDGSVGHQRDAV